jgi:hypothetical protein
LHASAFRPVHRQERNEIDVWLTSLAVGRELPDLPLALRGDGIVRLELEHTYAEACARSRL